MKDKAYWSPPYPGDVGCHDCCPASLQARNSEHCWVWDVSSVTTGDQLSAVCTDLELKVMWESWAVSEEDWGGGSVTSSPAPSDPATRPAPHCTITDRRSLLLTFLSFSIKVWSLYNDLYCSRSPVWTLHSIGLQSSQLQSSTLHQWQGHLSFLLYNWVINSIGPKKAQTLKMMLMISYVQFTTL